MMIVRAIEKRDLGALERLLEDGGVGMTSLPRDRDSLARRIEFSHRSFAIPADAPPAAKAEELFFFVMEDTATGTVVGTCAIKSGIGLEEPFYSYRLSKLVHSSRELGVYKEIPTLILNNDLTGCAEVASLFLGEPYRHGGNGRLLSRSRFLFLAQHPDRFPEKIIAEMRGVSDAQGRSPFWDSVGRHFFSMEFSRADYITGTRGKSFIAELMPRNPIYVPLLGLEAQEVIGLVHEDTRGALRLLQREGFHSEGYVDIFDAGATVEARVREVRAVRASRLATVRVGPVDDDAPLLLVANDRWQGFRCAMVPSRLVRDELTVMPATAEGLELQPGEPARVVAAQ